MWVSKRWIVSGGASPDSRRGAKFGEEARHRVVERDRALFDEAHRWRGDERFGHRGKAEHFAFAHRAAFFAIGEAGGATVDKVAVARDQHDAADDATLGQRPFDDGVEPGGKDGLEGHDEIPYLMNGRS